MIAPPPRNYQQPDVELNSGQPVSIVGANGDYVGTCTYRSEVKTLAESLGVSLPSLSISYDSERQVRTAFIESERDAKLSGTVEYQGNHYALSETFINELNALDSVKDETEKAGGVFVVTLPDVDNEEHEFDAAKIVEFGLIVAKFVGDVKLEARNKIRGLKQ